MINLDGVDSNLKFEGPFPTIIDTVEKKNSKAGNQMLVVTFKVIGDKFNGYKVKENFVLNNDYARMRLANLVDACGVDRNFEEKDLHKKVVVSEVYKKKNEDFPSISEWSKYESPAEEV